MQVVESIGHCTRRKVYALHRLAASFIIHHFRFDTQRHSQKVLHVAGLIINMALLPQLGRINRPIMVIDSVGLESDTLERGVGDRSSRARQADHCHLLSQPKVSVQGQCGPVSRPSRTTLVPRPPFVSSNLSVKQCRTSV